MKFLGTEVTQPTYISESAWLEHGPFATWLVRRMKPRKIVELGTHYGYSYFAMCETVFIENLPTECFAIDTWEGDEHAGFYNQSVFEMVLQENEQYKKFSKLIRKTFSDAVHDFEDGTIDLLHVDGRHFYEDVKEDFETWRSKLSESAVVMFHDTEVHKNNFGVHQFWKEITKERDHINFLHCNGLGVVSWSKGGHSVITDLVNAANGDWKDSTPQIFF